MQRFVLMGILTGILSVYGMASVLDAQEPEFTLAVEAPADVTGEGGETVEIPAAVELTSAAIAGESGAEGWSLSLSVENGVIAGATIDGTAGALDTEGGYRLADGFENTELTTGAGNEGVVSAVVLSAGNDATLPPSGTLALLQLTVEADVPLPVVSGGEFLCEPETTRIFFQDGLQGSGLPVENKVSYQGEAYRPTAALEAEVSVCPTILMPEFALSFNAPATVEGEAGATVEFEAVARLTTSGNPGADGAQGWSLSISAAYAEITAATVDGTAGAPVTEGGLREGDGFELTELTTGEDNAGVVSAVILSAGSGASLPPEGTADLLRVTLSTLVPEPVLVEGELVCSPLTSRLLYEDGLQGSGLPVENKVTYRGLSSRPTLFESTTEVCPEIPFSRPDFLFSLSAPESLEGAAGADLEFEALAQLTTANNPGSEGVQAWSFGVAPTGCSLLGSSYDGTAAAPVSEGGLREPDGFESTELTTGDGNVGLVSAVVLSAGQGGLVALPVEGTADLLRITVGAPAPALGGDCASCSLSFQDGLQGSGFPVESKVTYLGFAFVPDALRSVTEVCAVEVGGTQRPGDENQDGLFDISDAVALLDHLFIGTNPTLPCGDGTAADPANLALLDLNDDAGIDLSDPIFALNFLFLGGPLPANCSGDPACPCIRIENCPDNPEGDCAP